MKSAEDWARTARSCVEHLKRDTATLRQVLGDKNPLLFDMGMAQQLLTEAIERGVKEKEAA